jgi:glycosyltransferase involved in cell wall biosynthesis
MKIFFFYKLYKPNIVHHITLKPILYGSLISKILNINGVINAVSGLGFYFTNDRKSVIKNIIIYFLKYSCTQKKIFFIFQNKEDHDDLHKLGILNKHHSIVYIKGSGVDLNIFTETNLPLKDKIVILFPSRMLWDKGIKELKATTDYLKSKYFKKIVFILAGSAGDENKTAVNIEFLKKWDDGIYVKWVGYQKDIINFYKSSDIVILPSYREGIPKSLIEACAIGRPIITTNAIGCKDCVDHGVNGLKVNVQSNIELSNALIYLVNNPIEMIRMGKMSRIKAEKEFDLKHVIKKHLEIYNKIIY